MHFTRYIAPIFKLWLRVVAVNVNAFVPEVNSDLTMKVLDPTITLFEHDISIRIVLIELVDDIPYLHFFFLPALIQARVRALHFFSS